MKIDELSDEEEKMSENSSESEQKEIQNIHWQFENWSYFAIVASLFSNESLWLSSLSTLIKIGFKIAVQKSKIS